MAPVSSQQPSIHWHQSKVCSSQPSVRGHQPSWLQTDGHQPAANRHLLAHAPTYTVHAPHIYHTYTAHAPHIHRTYTAHAPHIHRACTAHAPRMHRTYPAHAPHIHRACTAHTPHIHWHLHACSGGALGWVAGYMTCVRMSGGAWTQLRDGVTRQAHPAPHQCLHLLG